ncbi:MAG: cytochrome c oxidase subunit II [Bacteroidota bacterium]|nr:cytochrome c oxidase subunit II [Bacteroidota bacterium]
MFAQATNYVKDVNATFVFITAICVFLLLLITFLMLYFVYKYNKKRNKKAENIHEHTVLEVIWTVIPTILVLFMFWYGWTDYKKFTDVPKDSMVIEVTGRMWQWSFTYPNGLSLDTLYVPLKRNIRLNLKSLDVNHSFYVPAFRVKKDVLPGRKNYIWFNADELGSYDVACSEYCGLRHSYMYTKVVVMPPAEWEIFITKKLTEISGNNKSDSLKTNPDSSIQRETK